MTISYLLSPAPFWYIPALNGQPLAPGGQMFTYDATNPTNFKPIYQDPAGNFPYPNPLDITANGTVPTIYWADDVPYNIKIVDKDENIVAQYLDYTPPGSGGGSVTENVQLDNLIVNNNFWLNSGNIAANVPQSATLAPGSHSAFLTPDITFFKNASTATDTLSFVAFGAGSSALSPDVTPALYLNYTCTGAGAGESLKYIQFPIIPNVNNLQQQTVTIYFWARCNAGSTTLIPGIFQYFGDGGAPSASVFTGDSQTLTADWALYNVQIVIPTTALLTIGTAGTDGVYLQLRLPSDATTNIDIAKPAVYLGTVAPVQTLDTYDQTNAIISVPRTGDVRATLNTFTGFGWVPMNDGTIGSASSGATSRANIDTVYLYQTIWNNVSDTYAPVTGGRGSSALADFVANKPMALTKQLGRAMSGSGAGAGLSTYVLGQTSGAETSSGVGSHTHTFSATGGTGTVHLSVQGNVGLAGATTVYKPGTSSPTDTAGGVTNVDISGTTDSTGAPFSIIDPRVAYNVFIKL